MKDSKVVEELVVKNGIKSIPKEISIWIGKYGIELDQLLLCAKYASLHPT
jgi:hypothetical protein